MAGGMPYQLEKGPYFAVTESMLDFGGSAGERLELLKGESTHEAKADGTVVLNVKIPIRQAPQIIT